MEKLNMIAGFPRSGSTLLANLLNLNPDFHATPTSPLLEMITRMRKVFSHNPSYRNMNRMDEAERFKMGVSAYIRAYHHDHKIVFDKNRGWTNKLHIVDELLANKDSKVVFCYRNPVEVFQSIEKQYQKTIVLENNDEKQNDLGFLTLENRLQTYIKENFTLMTAPVSLLEDAYNMGFGNRIFIMKYDKLCQKPQEALDELHEFIGESSFQYDVSKLKQSTFENDSNYNYKFLHSIREGEVKYSPTKITLPQPMVNRINDRFKWVINKVEKGK